MSKCLPVIIAVVVLLLFGCSSNSNDIINNDPIPQYDEESRLAASYFASGNIDGGGGGRGGINYIGASKNSFINLVNLLSNTKDKFNSELKHINAHKDNKYLEDWYLCLKDTIENDDKYLLQDEPFTETFEKTYGSLPDRDGDGTPDCIDVDPDDPDKDAYLTTESAIELLTP